MALTSITLGSILSLCILILGADCVRLIRENGFQANTHYYHLGDEGHAYHYNMETASSVYFKCVLYERGCRGRAILRVGGNFMHSKEHNHPPDPNFVGKRHFRENVLRQVLNSRFVDFKDIIDEARRDRRYSKRVRSKMTLRRLGSAMARVKGKSYPPIPHSLRELTQHLLTNGRVSKTVDGMENLYAGSVDATDGSHHIAFFSPRMLTFMGNLKLIQGDGTFKARPAAPASSQCFVIVTTWHNCVVPLGWVLMESRTLPAYRAVFSLLKRICPALNPEVIISDWEYPQQKAWEEAFPNAKIQGCLWHLCRAFIKKALKLRLLRFKDALPELFEFIKRACGICLLPPFLFDAGLQVLRNEARQADILVAFLLIPFFRYVETRWINQPRRQEWMTFFDCMLRTNNSCETHNRMLRKQVGAFRPNVFQFIEALARIEHNANLDTILMQQGGNARRTRRWKSVYQDTQLKALVNDLEMEIFHNEEEAISNCLSRAAHLSYNVFEDLLGPNRIAGQ